MANHIETGAVQFGEDWPGVFIRGKHAVLYANLMEIILDAIKHLDPPPVGTIFPEKVLRGMIDDLRTCDTSCNAVKLQLKPIEECRRE